eukprot:15731029-Heterocapsa_arctica.AAC.1
MDHAELSGDVGEPMTPMDTEREVQRGRRRLRDEDEAEEASQELEGRLRSSMVGAVETEGPP